MCERAMGAHGLTVALDALSKARICFKLYSFSFSSALLYERLLVLFSPSSAS